MSRARIVVGAVEPVPKLVNEAEGVLVGARLEPDTIAEAARVAAASCEPVAERNVDAATHRDLVAALVREALTDVRAKVAA